MKSIFSIDKLFGKFKNTGIMNILASREKNAAKTDTTGEFKQILKSNSDKQKNILANSISTAQVGDNNLNTGSVNQPVLNNEAGRVPLFHEPVIMLDEKLASLTSKPVSVDHSGSVNLDVAITQNNTNSPVILTTGLQKQAQKTETIVSSVSTTDAVIEETVKTEPVLLNNSVEKLNSDTFTDQIQPVSRLKKLINFFLHGITENTSKNEKTVQVQTSEHNNTVQKNNKANSYSEPAAVPLNLVTDYTIQNVDDGINLTTDKLNPKVDVTFAQPGIIDFSIITDPEIAVMPAPNLIQDLQTATLTFLSAGKVAAQINTGFINETATITNTFIGKNEFGKADGNVTSLTNDENKQTIAGIKKNIGNSKLQKGVNKNIVSNKTIPIQNNNSSNTEPLVTGNVQPAMANIDSHSSKSYITENMTDSQNYAAIKPLNLALSNQVTTLDEPENEIDNKQEKVTLTNNNKGISTASKSEPVSNIITNKNSEPVVNQINGNQADPEINTGNTQTIDLFKIFTETSVTASKQIKSETSLVNNVVTGKVIDNNSVISKINKATVQNQTQAGNISSAKNNLVINVEPQNKTENTVEPKVEKTAGNYQSRFANTVIDYTVQHNKTENTIAPKAEKNTGNFQTRVVNPVINTVQQNKTENTKASTVEKTAENLSYRNANSELNLNTVQLDDNNPSVTGGKTVNTNSNKLSDLNLLTPVNDKISTINNVTANGISKNTQTAQNLQTDTGAIKITYQSNGIKNNTVSNKADNATKKNVKNSSIQPEFVEIKKVSNSLVNNTVNTVKKSESESSITDSPKVQTKGGNIIPGKVETTLDNTSSITNKPEIKFQSNNLNSGKVETKPDNKNISAVKSEIKSENKNTIADKTATNRAAFNTTKTNTIETNQQDNHTAKIKQPTIGTFNTVTAKILNETGKNSPVDPVQNVTARNKTIKNEAVHINNRIEKVSTLQNNTNTVNKLDENNAIKADVTIVDEPVITKSISVDDPVTSEMSVKKPVNPVIEQEVARIKTDLQSVAWANNTKTTTRANTTGTNSNAVKRTARMVNSFVYGTKNALGKIKESTVLPEKNIQTQPDKQITINNTNLTQNADTDTHINHKVIINGTLAVTQNHDITDSGNDQMTNTFINITKNEIPENNKAQFTITNKNEFSTKPQKGNTITVETGKTLEPTTSTTTQRNDINSPSSVTDVFPKITGKTKLITKPETNNYDVQKSQTNWQTSFTNAENKTATVGSNNIYSDLTFENEPVKTISQSGTSGNQSSNLSGSAGKTQVVKSETPGHKAELVQPLVSADVDTGSKITQNISNNSLTAKPGAQENNAGMNNPGQSQNNNDSGSGSSKSEKFARFIDENTGVKSEQSSFTKQIDQVVQNINFPQTQTLPLKPVAVAQLSNRISEGLLSLPTQGKDEKLVLRAEIADLGSLQIELTNKDEHIQIVLRVQSEAARKTLEQSLPELQQNLSKQDMPTQNIQVIVSDQQGRETGSRERLLSRNKKEPRKQEKISATTLSTSHVSGNSNYKSQWSTYETIA